MRKTAVGIILAGFLFIFIRLSFMGIDLLIDAVGFLLLFNGARALQKIGRAEAAGLLPVSGANAAGEAARPPATLGFGAAQICAIILIIVSALQLFLLGVPGVVAGILRAAGETALLFFLLRGFGPMLQNGRLFAFVRLLPAAFALSMAAAVLSILFLFYTPALTMPALFAAWVFVTAAHVFTLVVFLALLIRTPGNKPQR